MEELRLQDGPDGPDACAGGGGRLQEAEETAQLWEILCGVLDQFVEILGEEHYGTGASLSGCSDWC
ncbi:MAG: hypothetical protein ACLSHO_08690 [Dysosmobacter sp.]